MPDETHRGLDFDALANQETESAPQGRNFLLVIGIDDYAHAGKLKNAVADAREVVRVLMGKYQFDAAFLTELYNEAATFTAIDEAFRRLARTIQPGDNLVVYFSGHGHYDEFYGEAYWVPVEARFGERKDYVAYTEIVRAISRIPTQHTFLIVDSCYSGAVLVGDYRSGQRDPRERDPSRWILASGRNEVVPDGSAGENSPFARELIDVLNRYADEGIPVLSLVDKVTTATIHNAKQKPIGRPLQGVGDKGGQFVFQPRHPAKPITKTQPAHQEKPKQTPPPVPTPIPTTNSSLWQQPAFKYVAMALLVLVIGTGIYRLSIRTHPPGQTNTYKELIRKGRINVEQGNYEAALTLFEQARRNEDTEEVQKLIKQVKDALESGKQGDPKVEEPDQRQADERKVNPPQPAPIDRRQLLRRQQDYKKLMEEGMGYYQNKAWEKAKYAFEKANSILPSTEAANMIKRCEAQIVQEQNSEEKNYEELLQRAMKMRLSKEKLELLYRAQKIQNTVEVQKWIKETELQLKK